MSQLLKIITHPLVLIFLFCLGLYWEVFFLGKVPLPADTLVGSYFPWLDYKWGFPTGVPVKNPPLSDAFSQFFLWKNLAVDLFKQGILPLWNKYAFAGTPLLASYHSAVLFPGNLLLFLPKIGWGLYTAASTLTAALCLYLYLRRWVKSPWARLAASLVFALAGPMTTWVEFGTGVWAASLLPLLLFCLDQILLEKKPIYLTVLSLSLTGLLLAGHAQIEVYAILLIIFYSLFLYWRFPNSLRLPKVLFVYLAALLGIALAAIQLLPSLDYFSASIRAEEKYSQLFNLGLIPLPEMIRLWAADFFGNPATYNHRGSFDYHEFSSFLGTLTLPLILPLVFRRYRQIKISHFFLAVCLISLFMVISQPVSQLIFSQPLPLLTYSSASRLLFITSLTAAILIGLGLDQLNKHRSYLIWSARWAIILISLTLLALSSLTQPDLSISLRNSLLPIFLLGILVVSSLSKINHRLLVIVFVVLLSFDLGRYFSKHTPFVPASLLFPSTPALEYFQPQEEPFRIAREIGPLLPPNSWINYRLESIEGYDPLQLSNYSRFFRVVSGDHYYDTVTRFAELRNVRPHYLDSLNLRYYLALKTTPNRSPSIVTQKLLQHDYNLVFEDKTVQIYQNPNALDRAYFINNYQVIKDTTEIAKTLESPDFDPRKQVILNQDPKINLSQTSGQIIEIDHHDNLVSLKTESEGPSLLVLADAYDPGWKAYINHQPAKIYQVNTALRGIIVPAGKNQITFNYFPNSLQLGIIISASSLILIFLLYFFARKTKL